jgi:Flp pilus assembly protein TadG
MGWAGLVRRVRRRRQEGSRGAVLVEFVLIAPVFALLVAGVLEFGLAFRDSMTVSNALRSGARVGSNAGRERLADYTILKSVEAAMKEVPTSRVIRVVVYKASTSSSNVPASCLTATAITNRGVDNLCNTYSAGDLTLASSAFVGTTNCTGAPDARWCPLNRQSQQALGADYLGVYMEVRYTYITKIFPGTGVTIRDRAVMRLEPRLP